MKKLLMMAGAAAVSAAVLAAQNDLLITFSTPGPDKYADGTTVLDGETYALVWSADGNFDGIKADGTTVDVNDQIVLCAPVAKDGQCPTLVYQVDAKEAEALAGGQYAVYLLDTRVKTAGGATALADLDADGKPTAVNATTSVGDSVAAASAGTITKSVTSATAVSGAAVATAAVVDTPVITSFKVDGAKIRVTVAGMSPIATYQVVSGGQPGTVATPVDATKAGDTFEFNKSDAKFFKVIGTRNFK